MTGTLRRLAGGDRAVLLIWDVAHRPEAFDPDPAATARRNVALMAIEAADPDGVARAITASDVATPLGIVGWGAGGRVALELGARHPELVDRVVAIATPAPLEAGATALAYEPRDVRAKTLLVHGGADATAGSRHGAWWQRHLPDARLEMTPGLGGEDLLRDRWDRVLSFLAPGSGRRATDRGYSE
jgi:pimeloyl-ACP methyl ester carboxylesterase